MRDIEIVVLLRLLWQNKKNIVAELCDSFWISLDCSFQYS